MTNIGNVYFVYTVYMIVVFFMDLYGHDPLVNVYIAIEHDHRNSGFSQLENGGSFHSYVNVYQRVMAIHIIILLHTAPCMRITVCITIPYPPPLLIYQMFYLMPHKSIPLYPYNIRSYYIIAYHGQSWTLCKNCKLI